ncbi:peptidoglycan DD-metalloendopeptidase family protein [Polaribacter haliotis]|uniref:Peptidoglycan DD-metalloendopeptidase family protein n=1 Tax=Polaribacter haliotis TaxID=1888915 RepID=A0A7L8ADR9_9FLAO|nr:peptidoglycan DD-metalloendopeptidase family protein [Polaribacter haliotis]QOD60077.1 peptidoglycan DD-metalloendopeptidase family protein [Polaribacter haliotis]
MKKALYLLLFIIAFSACNNAEKKPVPTPIKPVKPKPVYRYGYKIDDYKVIQDTIKSGESFGYILDRHHVTYPKINKIATSIKDIFDVRRVRAGKPYTILASKDSLEEAKIFIYKNDKIRATVVDFSDSIVKAHTYLQPIKTVERIVEGEIHSNLSNAMDSLHLSANLTNSVADIYAWTLDFYKLQKGDSFKLVFEEKFINDSLFAGYGEIKSAVFKHNGQDLYGFRFIADSIQGIPEYYDEAGNMLRSQFLKSPIKFQYRISSRYNLKRRIAYYGNRIKPHRGTDFAANIGTPIIATASGTVVESTRRGGNGKFVKIKHNSTYSTQYLHMKNRNVKKGQYVKQGDIIGWVGMTGNTGGPHVCYRFWKNGREVDPLSPKTKLPEAEPLDKKIKPRFLKFIEPLKYQLDYNQLPTEEPSVITEEVAQN